jgi:hypothetical protein
MVYRIKYLLGTVPSVVRYPEDIAVSYAAHYTLRIRLFKSHSTGKNAREENL